MCLALVSQLNLAVVVVVVAAALCAPCSVCDSIRVAGGVSLSPLVLVLVFLFGFCSTATFLVSSLPSFFLLRSLCFCLRFLHYTMARFRSVNLIMILSIVSYDLKNN